MSHREKLLLPVSPWKVLAVLGVLVSSLVAAGLLDAGRRSAQLREFTTQVCEQPVSTELERTLTRLAEERGAQQAFARFAAREAYDALAGPASLELVYEAKEGLEIVSPWSGPLPGSGEHVRPEWGSFRVLTEYSRCFGRKNGRFLVVLKTLQFSGDTSLMMVIRKGVSSS